VLSKVLVVNLMNVFNINSHKWCLKNGKFLGMKKYCQKLANVLDNSDFCNICQIWQHHATLSTDWATATNHAERAFPSCVETTAR